MFTSAVSVTALDIARGYSTGRSMLFIMGKVRKLMQKRNATVPNDPPKASARLEGNIRCSPTCWRAVINPPPGSTKIPLATVTPNPPTTATTPNALVKANIL
mmetsp:Transcript_3222/g.3238  ORF Transcript_3222/g.3238 Transcript_3222/m.3238 type:complete len:102 (-) Transcript_3222:748-1053(-)